MFTTTPVVFRMPRGQRMFHGGTGMVPQKGGAQVKFEGRVAFWEGVVEGEEERVKHPV